MKKQCFFLLVALICSEILTHETHTQQKDDEAYAKMTDIEKSKRCTGKYNKKVCNKVQHCCYWEYKDPAFDEFQPVCYDFDTFHKYYVRNDQAYILKINQSAYRTAVKQSNLCNLIANDDRFPEVKECSCHFISELSANTLKASIFLLTIITAFLN